MSSVLVADANVFLITESPKPQIKQQKRLFLICDDCFWVASAVSERYIDPVSCPMCHKQISSLPISIDERYIYNNARTEDEELDFYSDRFQRK